MISFGDVLQDYLEYYKITQTDFADRLGISHKHMNEIINGNTRLSQELMIAISLLTNIDVNYIFLVEQKRELYDYLYKRFNNEKDIKKFLNSFHINEMSKKKWIKLKDKTSVVQNALDLLYFMKLKDFDIYDEYVNKRILYKKSDSADLNKIYLWLRHCDNLVCDISVEKYSSKNLDKLFDELNAESLKKFNKDRIIKILNNYGIILCVEDALDGTKIRGCSMVKKDTPVIYLTTYFKEKASFYFTLYHELYHIKSDYNKLINKANIDDLNEDKADMFALDKMINSKTWLDILKDFKNNNIDLSKYNISKSFIYSRLAYEGHIEYNSKLYNDNIERIEIEQ